MIEHGQQAEKTQGNEKRNTGVCSLADELDIR